MPMEISFRSLAWSVENCLRRLIKDPFPKDLLMEAWNARQGCSLDSNRTQAACFAVSIWQNINGNNNGIESDGMYESILRRLP